MAARKTKAQLASEMAELKEKALAQFKPKVTKLGGEWKALEKKSTQLKVSVGSLSASMMTALVSVQYPEADRETAIMADLEAAGIVGFKYATIAEWKKASDTYAVLPPEIRDRFPIYSLRDLAGIPTDPEHRTGGRVKVAQAALDAGCVTDDEIREFVKVAKRPSDWSPPALPTIPEQAVAIATANKDGYPVPVLVPEMVEDEDGKVHVTDTYVVTFEQLVNVALFGYAWRDKGGGGDRRSQAAYRLTFETALHGKPAAAEADGSGASDAEAAATEAAREARIAAEAALKATETL